MTDRRDQDDISADARSVADSKAGSRRAVNPWAIAGHEVRAPIAAIAALAEHILDGDLSEEQRRNVAALKTTAHQVIRLADRLLDEAEGRVPQGPNPDFIDTLDLSYFGPRVSRLQRARATKKGLGFQTRFDVPEGLHIRIDSVALGQTVGNLIDNALKYTKDGEIRFEIAARAHAGDDQVAVTIVIEDTGPGIPDAAKPFLFQLSERPLHTDDVPGAGFGLTIVRRKVAVLGGKIRVEDAVGGGARFVVDLICPRAELDERRGGSDSDNVGMPGQADDRPRILVVDDNRTNRRLFSAILDKIGYCPVPAGSGVEALDIAATLSIAAVLMDLEMPEMDGAETASALRRRFGPHLSIISVSAHRGGIRDDVAAGLFDAAIEKPVSVRALYEALDACVASGTARPLPAEVS
ncbi:MAG: ATP-binding protein [Pseudomonadota bacterium]